MKKLKNASIAIVLTLGLAFMFNTQTSNAEELPEGSWVCCKSLSTGCVTIDGMYFPDDYKKFAPNCDGPIENQ
tara:strand:+ start:27 stop:245 length:219 start_codon:yes stop_codon:yes gene_type:complete